MIKYPNPSCSLLFASVLALTAAASDVMAADHYVAGLSPHLPAAARETAWKQFSEFILTDLKPGDVLDVYDALSQKRVAHFNLPDDPAMSGSPRARLRLAAKELGDLKTFLRSGPADAAGPAGADWAVDELKFLELAGTQLRTSGENLAVLLAGSALHRDGHEPAFDFVGGYYPSDGYLQGDRTHSPFGTRGLEKALAGVMVYHWFPLNECESTAAQQGVARFWELYTSLQGGTLAAYAEDAAAVFERFRHGVREAVAKVEIDPGLAKPEMIRRMAQPAREERGWITATHVDAAAPLTTPIVRVLRIGARWSENVDVDIYGATRGNPELYYGHSRSAEGVHIKDYTTAPSTGENSYEIIEFTQPVDLRRLGAWLNLYSGRVNAGGIMVEVRVWADDKVYSRNIRIPCTTGNHGENATGRTTDPHWANIDVASIVGLR